MHTTPNEPPILEARQISKSFGLVPALRGANVAIRKGEIVAIMGPSGSGKSTLLHCLAGIMTPDEGDVYFSGTRLNGLNEERRTLLRRTSFGFVFQFGQLLPELTAADNVALPLLLNKVPQAEAYRQAVGWLTRFALAGKEQRTPGELSGGEVQRVAIARAMAINPPVLFADEPTGSLDTLNGEKVMEIFTATVKQQGTTLVIVTHDARVAAYAERQILVRDGRVTYSDTQVATV